MAKREDVQAFYKGEAMVPKSMYDAVSKENYDLKKKLGIKEQIASQAMGANTNLFQRNDNILKGIRKTRDGLSVLINEMKILKREKQTALGIARARKDNNLTIKYDSEIKVLEIFFLKIEKILRDLDS